jgi:hypothetical protein
MKLISSLTESQLLPSKVSYGKYSAKQIAEMVYLHVITLRILFSEHETKDFASQYALRSSRYIGFASWYQNASDLHLLIHALLDETVELKLPDMSNEFREKLYFDEPEMKKWLKQMTTHGNIDQITRKLFLHLDFELQIKDGSLKAIRRLVQDWDHITIHQKKLAMTRLLQFMRTRCKNSDLMKHLNTIAHTHGLEIENVANPETGDEPSDEPKKKGSVLKHIAAFAGGLLGGHLITSALSEEDSSVASDIAPVVKPLEKVRKRNVKP